MLWPPADREAQGTNSAHPQKQSWSELRHGSKGGRNGDCANAQTPTGVFVALLHVDSCQLLTLGCSTRAVLVGRYVAAADDPSQAIRGELSFILDLHDFLGDNTVVLTLLFQLLQPKRRRLLRACCRALQRAYMTLAPAPSLLVNGSISRPQRLAKYHKLSRLQGFFLCRWGAAAVAEGLRHGASSSLKELMLRGTSQRIVRA